jgi:hypothetical protein
MPITIKAVDTTETPLRIPAGPFAPGSPVWVEARPGLRRIHTLAGDTLAALGKRRDLSGKGRNQSEDVAHAVAWLQAYDTSDLVVTEAQRLHPLILRNLCSLAENANTNLWLLHAPPRSDAFMRILAHRATETHVVAMVPAAVPAAKRAPAAPDRLPAVPDADFTTFRATYLRELPSAVAANVDARFRRTLRTCDEALARDGATPASVAGLVHDLLNPAPADPELTVDIRALQVAAWHHDLYVKVDLPRLLHNEERPRMAPHVSDDAMTAYRQPYRAITVALTRAGHALQDLTAITLADAAACDGSVLCAGICTQLSDTAARAVAAQRYLRHAAGALDDDVLLPHTSKALAKALTDAANDVGVHVYGRRAERTRPHTHSALRRLGITIAVLP